MACASTACWSDLYSNAYFIHTWAEPAGLSFDGFEPSLSIVSEQFKWHPLLIGEPYQPDPIHPLDIHPYD